MPTERELRGSSPSATTPVGAGTGTARAQRPATTTTRRAERPVTSIILGRRQERQGRATTVMTWGHGISWPSTPIVLKSEGVAKALHRSSGYVRTLLPTRQ